MRAKYYSLVKKSMDSAKRQIFWSIPNIKIYALNLEITKMKIDLCIYLESGVINYEKTF